MFAHSPNKCRRGADELAWAVSFSAEVNKL